MSKRESVKRENRIKNDNEIHAHELIVCGM